MNKEDIFKVNILYEFHEGPWGGGNQFLKALREKFIRRGIYVDNPTKADCIIFNSHHNIKKLMVFTINSTKIFRYTKIIVALITPIG